MNKTIFLGEKEEDIEQLDGVYAGEKVNWSHDDASLRLLEFGFSTHD